MTAIQQHLDFLRDIPIWDWIIPDGGCLDIDNCPDCWERNAHIERYAFACEVFRDSKILDYGCGVGYGSEMLAESANQVTGVDSSFAALGIALERRGSCAEFLSQMPDRKFHGCVCFEVLEHMDEPITFLKDISQFCRHLVISTPITPTVKNNPHHKSDFTREQFREMVGGLFSINWEFCQTRPWRREPAYCVIHGASRVFRG